MPDLSPVRADHFRRHPLLWMALNHFLSADLLRELYAILVDEVSQRRLSLSEVVEDQLTAGASSLRSWTIRPRPGPDPVAGYLQQLAQVMLWAGDQSASPNPGGDDPHLRRWAEDLGLAQRLATAGLEVDLPKTAAWPEGLRPLATALHALRAPGDVAIDVPAIAEGVARAVEAPLSGVLVKHLGDLCAAQDAWTEANQFYALARPVSTDEQDGAWDAFNADFDDIVHQSIAAGCWALSGPDTAVVVLEEPFETATLSTRPLLLANGKQDEMVARFSDRKGIDFAPDDRPVTRAAPLLAHSQDVSRAWHAWMQRRFDTAERFFNAALRRQIALGSVTAVRETKIAFGRCVLDSLEAQLNRQHSPDRFRKAVRLMIESGHAEAAAGAAWTAALVRTYVTAEAVREALDHVAPEMGENIERLMVAIALVERWLELLPRDAGDLPAQMLTILAQVAEANERSFNSAHDLGGRSLKGLRRAGQARPETGRQAAGAVAAAVEAHLAGADFLAIEEALRTLAVFREGMAPARLAQTLARVLDMMDRIGPKASHWSTIGPALDLLTSEAAKRAIRDDPELTRRLTQTTVRFALEEGSENARLLFLLRDLDPTILAVVDAAQLEAVIADVARRAQEIHVSSAASCIYALLSAPRLVGRKGIEAALAGLHEIIRSARTRRSDVSFPPAADATVLLGERASLIAKDLDLQQDAFQAAVGPLFEDLVEVWRLARDKPLTFAGFSIPRATAPSPVLVHNWAYGSLALASWLGRSAELQAALDTAEQAPALADGIAGARAARVIAGDDDTVRAEVLAKEPREAFYGALGRRILNLRDVEPTARAEPFRLLLDRAFVLGPHGLDAGLFTAALAAGLDGTLALTDARVDYRRRLNADRELRLCLFPLFQGLFPEEPPDEE